MVMIGQLTGTITYRSDRYTIVDVGGVGYKIYASDPTLGQANVGQNNTFWTHLVVREDVLDLYGFIEKAELELFELLISVSGVGPRGALSILSLATPQILSQAIAAGNTDYLTRVSGIGKRIAEKVVVELRDKLAAISTETDEHFRQAGDAMEAMKSLGYSDREAREALSKIDSNITDTGEIVKEALKQLSKN